MTSRGLHAFLCLSVLLACMAITGVSSRTSVQAHDQSETLIVARETEPSTANPHSDLIFRATGAGSCADCHATGKNGTLNAQPLENDLVRKLRDKAKGIHGPGRFADCLRCHAGGRKGVEKY